MVHSAAREKHGPANTRWLESYTYLDGLGGELMKKVQAEPGLASLQDAGRRGCQGPKRCDTSGQHFVAMGRQRGRGP